MADELEPARQEAARLLAETGREADKQFDSRKHIAPRKLEEFQKQLDAWKVRIGQDREQAMKLLKRWRQTPPVAKSETASGLATTGDLATRMQQRVDFVAQQLAQLGQLSSPKMAISWVLALFWVLLVLGGAAAATFMDPGPIVGGIVLGSGFVLGILGRLMLRSTARSGIRELYPPLIAAAREVEEMVQGASEKAKTQTADAQTKLIEWREQVQSKADEKHQARIAQIDAKSEQSLKSPTKKYEERLAQISTRYDRDMKEAEATRSRRKRTAPPQGFRRP